MLTTTQTRGAGLTLQADESGTALLASVEPVADAGSVDEDWLRQQVEALGYGQFRYLPEAATLLLGHYNAGRAVAALRLAEAVDAQLEIQVSKDAMEAALDITPAQGGSPVSKTQVLAALAEKGITEGILLDEINQAIAAGEARGLVIARGRPPEHGQDGYFESLIPAARDRKPRLTQSGQIDYRDMGDILVVHPDDPLMRRHRATPGTPGATVLGNPIPPRPGKDVMYATKLQGVSIAQGDPDLLLASQTGQPVQLKDGMMVEPVFSLPAVNMASGNVNFDGSVVIKGDVSAGMTVKASGDIEVGGVVENAHLEAGGSIHVKGGVLGAIDQKSGADYSIRCAHDFHAAYAQKARVEAGDSIFIDDMAMQCELTAGQHVKVGKAKRGHIIGGRIQAMLSITARVLGAPNHIATHCHIGVNPSLQKQARELAGQRDTQENQLLEISKLLEFARQHPERLRPEMVAKARQTAANLSAEIARLRDEEKALADQIALAQGARVLAEETLHEGVEVYLGSLHYKVVGDHGAGQVALGDGALELSAPQA